MEETAFWEKGQEQLYFFLFFCISSGKPCPWKVTSVPTPVAEGWGMRLKIQLKPWVRRTRFHSPSVYRTCFLSMPKVIWGHSTSPFSKFRVDFCICVAWGLSPAFLAPQLGVKMPLKEGNIHLPLTFPFPPQICSSPALVGQGDTALAVTFFFSGEVGKAKGSKCPGTGWRRRKWRQSSLNCSTKGSGAQKIQQEPPGGITPGHGQRCISCLSLRKDSFCCWNITGSFREPYLLKSWDV